MPDKLFSKISDGTEQYVVKDSTARSSIATLDSKVDNLGLNDLANVNFTNLSNGQVPVYDAANEEWVNGAGGGGNVNEWVGTTSELEEALDQGDIDDDTNILVTDDSGSEGVPASDVSYDNTWSEMSATNVQDGIDELVTGLRAAGDMYKSTYDPNNDGIIGTAQGGTGNAAGYIRSGQLAGSSVGSKATIEGSDNTSSGTASHSEGSNNIASGTASHSEGDDNTASGDYAHAEGYNTTASGAYAHAEGSYTRANKDGMHASGKYNDYASANSTNYDLVQVGNGTDDGSRSNAFTVRKDGSVGATGGLGIQLKSDSTKKIKFGMDSFGNYGYYKDGADSVTPFNQPIPDTYYLMPSTTIDTSGSDFAEGYDFDTTKPRYHFTTGQSFAVPVGNQDKCLSFAIGSDGSVVLGQIFSANASVYHIQPTSNVVAATAAIVTYGFDVIGLWYIDSNTFLMMYSWQTSATARSITYLRAFGSVSGKMFMSNADSTFAASLISDLTTVAGSVYAGRIMKTDFLGNSSRLGIAYARTHITSAGAKTGATLWHGYIAAYVTTTANFISISRSMASSYSIAPTQANTSFKAYFGPAGFVFSGSNSAGTKVDRWYYQRDTASTTGVISGFGYTDYPKMPDELKSSTPIGRLEDGVYVFRKYSYQYYLYNILLSTTSGAVTLFEKVGEVSGSSPYNGESILLRGNILLVRQSGSSSNLGAMYQIIKRDDGYKIEFLMKIGFSEGSEGYGSNYYNSSSFNVGRPNGLYSDTFRGIGPRLNKNQPDIPYNFARNSMYPCRLGDKNIYTKYGNTRNLYCGDKYFTEQLIISDSDSINTLSNRAVAEAPLTTTMDGVTVPSDYAFYLCFTNRNYGTGARGDVYFSYINKDFTYSESISLGSFYGAQIIKPFSGMYGKILVLALSNTGFKVYKYDVGSGVWIYMSDDLTASLLDSTDRCTSYNLNYGLVGGGTTSGSTLITTVNAFDSNGTKVTASALSKARKLTSRTFSTAPNYQLRSYMCNYYTPFVKNYALFAGGDTGTSTITPSAVVDAYDNNLTKTTPTALGTAREYPYLIETETYTLVMGGLESTMTAYSKVDAYDNNLTKVVSQYYIDTSYGRACHPMLFENYVFIPEYAASGASNSATMYLDT